MNTLTENSRAERNAQDCLVAFLSENLENQQAFLALFPDHISSHFGALRKPVSVTQNVPTSAGGFIDVLLQSGAKALVIELKINHRENPFQYTHYRNYLRKSGFDTRAIGILSNSEAMRGRANLTEAILSIVADARISWGELLTRLQKDKTVAKAALRLAQQLEIIYPGAGDFRRIISSTKPAAKNLTFLENSPDTLASFMRDVVTRLPEGMHAFPDQAGSSPPLLRIGRNEWAKFAEDEDPNRIILNFDIPRPSKRIDQLYFHFCVGIYTKAFSGAKRPANPRKLAHLANHLANQGYSVVRNTPGKYHTAVNWKSPYPVGESGFFWANAFDDSNYRRSLAQSRRLGWEATVEEVIMQVERIAGNIEAAIQSFPR